MLELEFKTNTWTPQAISDKAISNMISAIDRKDEIKDWLLFLRTDPFVDMFFISFKSDDNKDYIVERFTIHPGYFWNQAQEEKFEKLLLKHDSPLHFYGKDFDRIYEYYSNLSPEWHLKRYYTHEERMLDHIYHCMRKNTIKEMLYKSGLDELAVSAPRACNVNLLATNPSEIYDHVPMRVIRALNTEYGAKLLGEDKYRDYLKALNKRFPAIFNERLNDAQCEYLKRLKDGSLTMSEIGRLYMSRRPHLSSIWIHAQFTRFIQKEESTMRLLMLQERLYAVDPIYSKYLKKTDSDTRALVIHYMVDIREDLE